MRSSLITNLTFLHKKLKKVYFNFVKISDLNDSYWTIKSTAGLKTFTFGTKIIKMQIIFSLGRNNLFL